MLDTYRRILRLPGTASMSATALVARMPMAMLGLGIVLLVEAETGSYGLAGAMSAAQLVAGAVVAVFQGRLIDRLGQARVLVPVITAWVVALALFVWSIEQGWPTAVSFALAALTGLTFPSVGSCVRARWAHVLPDAAQRHTAFSLEAVADEVVYIAGPILVTVLATAVHPVAGLTSAAVFGALGTWAFAAQRRTEPPAHRRGPRGSRAVRPPLPWLTLGLLTLVCACLGTLFGSVEVATVAFAEEQGNQSWAGPLLALWAVGSLAAGVISGALTFRRTALQRLRLGSLGMGAAMVPLALVDSTLVMGAFLLVAGFAIAPTMIASMTLAEQVVPASRLTEGMAFVQTGIVAGVAPGAALAGMLIDAHGASPAYLVAVAGGLVALLASWVIPSTGGRADEAAPAPATSHAG